MSEIHQKSSPPHRPSEAFKPKNDDLHANDNRYDKAALAALKQQKLQQQEKPRTVAIPELPTDLDYPPGITVNAPSKPPKKHSSSQKKKTSSSSSKKGTPLDVIDKLDVTGMFGLSSFHHDGPFDACRPHRNQRNSRAPVAAFPADGPNNTFNGVDYQRGNQNTENRIMGRADNEAFEEFSLGVQKQEAFKQSNQSIRESTIGGFDPTMKGSLVHGSTSLGLGTSTFLEGTPAPKAVETEQTERAQAAPPQIKRKKSIVQRLRGNSHSSGSAVKTRARAATNPMPPMPTDFQISSPEVVSYTDLEIKPPLPPPSSSSSSSGGNQVGGSASQSTGGSLLRRVKSLKMVTSRSRRTAAEQS